MMDTLTGRLGPRELALAASFGILLGLLVPKANLLLVALAILFFLSHANIVAGISIAVVVSLATPWIYPLTHRIGGDVLTSSGGQLWIGRLFQIPLLPWTGLDDTVVLGSFLLGLALFLPIFIAVWIPLKIVWPAKKEEKNEEEAEDFATAG